MMRLALEITTTNPQGKIGILALSELLYHIHRSLIGVDFILLQGPPQTRTVIVSYVENDPQNDAVLTGELVTTGPANALASGRSGRENEFSTSHAKGDQAMADAAVGTTVTSGDKVRIKGLLTYSGVTSDATLEGVIVAEAEFEGEAPPVAKPSAGAAGTPPEEIHFEVKSIEVLEKGK